MRLVLTSDTHNQTYRVKDWPDGDVLVVAGDLTEMGTIKQVAKEAEEIGKLPYQHKLVVAGNHDFLFQRAPQTARSFMRDHGITYLEDDLTTIEGVTFYGSPWTPRFGGWAFMSNRGPDMLEHWVKVPEKVDVLITHGPPRDILDKNIEGVFCGCDDLKAEIFNRIQPRLHVFGHIHEAYGIEELVGTVFINPSLCTRWYEPLQAPIVYDL